MRWQRLGSIFCPNGQRPWMKSHAANPVAEQLEGDLFRVYFGCRDDNNRTHIGTIVLRLDEHVTLEEIAREPILAPGEPGLFDDSGTSMGTIIHDGDAAYLYYIGWNLGVTVPFRNSIGLAVREGRDGEFVKVARAPVVDRDEQDPLSLSYPWVMREAGVWRMWYGSNLAWGPTRGEMVHAIKSAWSLDGQRWQRDGEVLVGPRLPDEPIVCRPCVIHLDGMYRMWYCRRDQARGGKAAPYRLGYAESEDGVTWERRDDEVGLEPSGEGWDSEEVTYPSLFRHRGALYMLYNGNGFGRTGFGLARAA
jgi:predicted GH43/DUF377 family glycosyl hydrolase